MQREAVEKSFACKFLKFLHANGVSGDANLSITSIGEGTVSGSLLVSASFEVNIPAYLVESESNGEVGTTEAG